MGDGVKLAEAERPPISIISKRLDDRVSRKIQNIFVQDIQNDCSCTTETYDSDFDKAVTYLSEEGIKIQNMSPLPMMNDISEKDVLNLIETACNHAGNECGDVIISKMIYNPSTYGLRLKEVWEKSTGRDVHFTRSGETPEWIPMDFVPVDCVYLIPEPEFFGCLSVNIEKFGAFCFSHNIIKVPLQDENQSTH